MLVGLLVAADRVGLALAERTVEERLTGQPPFSTAPQVHAEGFPFLTQVLGGSYRHIQVSGRGLTLGQLHGVGFEADLHGVHVPLSALARGQVDVVPVDRADGTVVIPYAEFARATGVSGLRLTESDGRLTATAPVKVPYVGRTVDVVADGRIALSGQRLELTVDNIRVAGVSLPGVVVRAASDLINSAVTLPALPYGLQLRTVSSRADGLHVTAHGDHLTIRPS